MDSKITLFPVLLILFITPSVQAQRNTFESGYYITTNGDSIAGYLRFNFDKPAQNLPQFKANLETATVLLLLANSVRRVGWHDGIFYDSRQLSVNNKTSSSFIRPLVRGAVSLYEMPGQEEGVGDSYFLERQGQFTRIPSIGINNFINVYFKDCPAITARAKKYRHTLESLVELVADYNQCINPSATTEVLIKKKTIDVHVGGKIYYNTGYFELPTGSVFDFGDEKQYPFNSVGVGTMVEMTSNKFGVLFEIAYIQHTASKDSVKVLSEISRLDLKFDYLELPLSLNYKINAKSFVIYPMIGLHGVFILSDEFMETIIQTVIVSRKQPFIQSFDKTRFAFGFMAGLGLSRNFSSGNNVFIHARRILIESEFRQRPAFKEAQSDLFNRKVEIAVGYSWRLSKF